MKFGLRLCAAASLALLSICLLWCCFIMWQAGNATVSGKLYIRNLSTKSVFLFERFVCFRLFLLSKFTFPKKLLCVY